MNNNDNTKKSNNPILLSNGCYVYPDILNFVRDAVTERTSMLSPDTVYSLKQIIGEELWDTLSKINRIDAGFCMVHLVAKRELPFRAVEGKHEYPKLYQLTSTQLGTRIP